MLQVRGGSWPDRWKPIGWDRKSNPNDETFASWWQRCSHEFPALDPRVLEQWVFAHWNLSPYFGFPVQSFSCTVERIATDVLISQVGQVDCWRNDPFYADAAYEAFSRLDIYQPMTSKGTWDMPILLVHDSCGFAYDDIEIPQFPYWLLEGHRRHDYLRGLAFAERSAAEHDVLVLRQIRDER